MKSLIAASAALFLLPMTAAADAARMATFACGGQDYVLLREASAEGAYRLGRVETGGRRVRVVAAVGGAPATPEAICLQVAALCGEARILRSTLSDPAAPVCLAAGLD